MSTSFEGFRIYKLQRHRVNLPKEIAALLRWFQTGEEHEALAMPSPHGGIVVMSPQARETRDDTLSQLEEDLELIPEDLGSEEFARALLLRVSWTVRIGPDGRFTLPEDARAAGMVPRSPNGKVAVAVVMDAIQVWDLDELPSALRKLARH